MSKNKHKKIKVGDLLTGAGSSFKRCYESHPVIEFPNEGKESGWLAGGNCGSPIHSDYDVYVGLDWCFQPRHRASYPWEPEHKTNVIEFQFKITDGAAPADTENAKKMVTWLCNQLQQGKKVHIGCIGGHGRTGMIIAAIMAEWSQMEDAITWVRENYCKKAVESAAQVNWLNTHYGIKKVAGSKQHHAPAPSGGNWPSYDPGKKYGSTHGGGYSGYSGSSGTGSMFDDKQIHYGGTSNKVTPMSSKRNIWQKTA